MVSQWGDLGQRCCMPLAWDVPAECHWLSALSLTYCGWLTPPPPPHPFPPCLLPSLIHSYTLHGSEDITYHKWCNFIHCGKGQCKRCITKSQGLYKHVCLCATGHNWGVFPPTFHTKLRPPTSFRSCCKTHYSSQLYHCSQHEGLSWTWCKTLDFQTSDHASYGFLVDDCWSKGNPHPTTAFSNSFQNTPTIS